jgi:hypothetical protein
MDIDKQILELEGKTIPISLGSKTTMFKAGLSLLLSLIFLYVIRPYYMLNVEADPVQKKCVAKLNLKYYLLSSVIFTGIFYYLLQSINIFTD